MEDIEMTDDEVIVAQAKEIAILRKKLDSAVERIQNASLIIYGIGGPLNDNKLGFTPDQLKVFHNIINALGD